MKPIASVVAVLVAAATLPAGAASDPTTHERCEIIADFAGQVMTLRQDGYSASYTMNEAISAVDGLTGWGEKELRMARFIVTGAYRFPRYRSMVNYQGAITSFTDKTFLGCMEAHENYP